MSYSKLVRLTRDAEIATTPAGKQVVRISAAHDLGWGDKKSTVWISASAWGDRFVKLADYLKKGVQVVLHCDDVYPDSYSSDKGTSLSLRMTVVKIELVARQSEPTSNNNQASQSKPVVQVAQQSADFEDDFDCPF